MIQIYKRVNIHLPCPSELAKPTDNQTHNDRKEDSILPSTRKRATFASSPNSRPVIFEQTSFRGMPVCTNNPDISALRSLGWFQCKHTGL